jgi:hypothetical protein
MQIADCGRFIVDWGLGISWWIVDFDRGPREIVAVPATLWQLQRLLLPEFLEVGKLVTVAQ